MATEYLGKIITFYSFKGGTGRSLALANMAWILASAGKHVLTVDWDLEAPGLHRYFAPFLIDEKLTATDGVIDFVWDFAIEALTPHHDSRTDPDWYRPLADLTRYAVSLEWDFTAGGLLDFVPAGRQGPHYSARVNSFDWTNFFEHSAVAFS